MAQRVAIKRIGKVYVDEDGGTVVDGWTIDASVLDDYEPRILTTEEAEDAIEAWTRFCAERAWLAHVGQLEPADGDQEVFTGWTLKELAKLSIELGEGATLNAS